MPEYFSNVYDCACMNVCMQAYMQFVYERLYACICCESVNINYL